VLLPIQHDFRGRADLCKSGKGYLNAETCKLYSSSVLQNFWHIVRFSINKHRQILKSYPGNIEILA